MKKEKGRSLVELIGVLAVIAVISAITLTTMQFVIKRHRMSILKNKVLVLATKYAPQNRRMSEGAEKDEILDQTKCTYLKNDEITFSITVELNNADDVEAFKGEMEKSADKYMCIKTDENTNTVEIIFHETLTKIESDTYCPKI